MGVDLIDKVSFGASKMCSVSLSSPVGGRVHQNLDFWSDNVAQGFIH